MSVMSRELQLIDALAAGRQRVRALDANAEEKLERVGNVVRLDALM